MERLFVIDLKDYDENWERSLRPTTRAIIIKDDKLAMVYNQKYDFYAFPGGGIEEGEDFYHALIREVREEVGLIVKPETIKEFGSALRISSSKIFEKTIFEQENFYYICQVEDVIEEQILEGYEAEQGFELAFVTPEDALRKNRFDNHKDGKDAVWLERETRIIEMFIEKIKEQEAEKTSINFTNEMIKKIAMEQSAFDANCNIADFMRDENVIVTSKPNERARVYLKLPHVCNLISYGENIVATISEEYRDIVEDYIGKYSVYRCFETPNMQVLNDAFMKLGYRVCFMAEYFLSDVTVLKEIKCDYEIRILHKEDFAELYTDDWSNALCSDRKEYDVLGVGAYHDGKLIGLAGCSADCETMWQIGVDVLEEYRKQGIASALTSRLAIEILKRGKVPFYCCAWSNIKSARNAIKSGFRPAWVEMTVKSSQMVDDMNRI